MALLFSSHRAPSTWHIVWPYESLNQRDRVSFFEAVDEGVALGFDVVLNIEDALALGALRFFQIADLSLEGVLPVNRGGKARLAVQGFDLRLGVGQLLLDSKDHVVRPALQALALLLEDLAVGFESAGDGGFAVALGLFFQAVGRRGLWWGGLDGCAATEKFFARFLIERVAAVGDGGEKQVFLALERFDGEFLQEQPAGLAFEGFDGGNPGGVAGEIKNDGGNRRGALPERWALRYAVASRMAVGRLNFSSNSRLHCLRMEAGQMTSKRRRRSAQSWQRTRPASMVLPRPTSSASRTPLLRGDFRANRAASIWCGFRSTVALNKEAERRSTSAEGR